MISTFISSPFFADYPHLCAALGLSVLSLVAQSLFSLMCCHCSSLDTGSSE